MNRSSEGNRNQTSNPAFLGDFNVEKQRFIAW